MNKTELIEHINRLYKEDLNAISKLPDDIVEVEYVGRYYVSFKYMKTLDDVFKVLHILRKTLGTYKLKSYSTFDGYTLEIWYKFESLKDVTFKFNCRDTENALEVLSQGKCQLVERSQPMRKTVVCGA